MKKRTSWWKIILAALGVLILSLVLFILFVFDWNILKGFIENKASEKASREIKIDGDIDVYFSWPLNASLEVRNVNVGNMKTGTAPHMVTAKKASVTYSLLSWFDERYSFPLIHIEDAVVSLEKDKDGNANWLFGDKSEKDDDITAPEIGQLIVRNTQVGYKDATEDTDLQVTVNSGKDFRTGSKTKQEAKLEDFIFIKGDGKYKNKPVKINYKGASILELENRESPYPLNTHINIGNTEIVLSGTVTNINELEGLNLTLNIKGADAYDLFPIFGIALPPTPPYKLIGKLDYEDKIWKFSNFKGRMGDSDLTGNLSWNTTKQRPLLTANFISNRLDFDDLGGFIGATPSTKAGETSSTAQKEKSAKKQQSPYVLPDTALDITRLASMDAKVEFTGKRVNSTDLPLDDFYLNVDLDNSLLKIQPVKFGTANGDVSANLTVNARKKPIVIDGDFQFKKLALARLLKKTPGDDDFTKGLIGGSAKLRGTGKSLREMLSTSDGTIGIGMEGGQLSNLLIELIGLDVAESLGFFLAGDKPVPIRCIVADFDVKNGVMKTKNFVIDTNDTNITGKGIIHLKTEEMEIKLTPKPKDGSILSLKSPVYITGTMKNPHFSIDPKNLILRGGAAIVVSAVLTPIAGALAFVEPGLGKDSNCAKLIGEMKSDMGAGNAGLIPKNKVTPKKKKKD